MSIIQSERDVCPEWTDNIADGYGGAVGSFASKVKKGIQGGDGNHTVINGTSYVVRNQASRSLLPTITLEVTDEFGQGPAVVVDNITIQATMMSPDNFFTGSVAIFLEGGVGNFSNIIGFQQPGRYTLNITFSEESIEAFIIIVEIRDCTIGETTAANGSFCQSCSPGTYNFLLEPASTCLPCHKDSICNTHFIRPRKGHWHQFPCSNQIQRCMTNRACDFDDRDEKLAELTTEMLNCTFDQQFITEYTQAQCRKVSLLLSLACLDICSLFEGSHWATVWFM